MSDYPGANAKIRIARNAPESSVDGLVTKGKEYAAWVSAEGLTAHLLGDNGEDAYLFAGAFVLVEDHREAK